MATQPLQTTITSGGTAILPDSWEQVIDYDFPPTNYQSAPQPTQNICDCDYCPLVHSAADTEDQP